VFRQRLVGGLTIASDAAIIPFIDPARELVFSFSLQVADTPKNHCTSAGTIT